MNREERAVAITGLTFFMFGLSIYMSDGSFVVPFPLNEFALLLVSFLFLIWHPKKGALPYLFFVSTVTGVLGSVVFWETVMSAEDLITFLDRTVVDWARITQGFFLVVAMIVFLASYREWYFKMIVAVAIGLYCYGFYINSLHHSLIAFTIMMVIGILKSVRKPFHLMWVLYFLLNGMAWVTIQIA